MFVRLLLSGPDDDVKFLKRSDKLRKGFVFSDREDTPSLKTLETVSELSRLIICSSHKAPFQQACSHEVVIRGSAPLNCVVFRKQNCSLKSVFSPSNP